MSATHSPGAIYDPSTGRDISDPLHPIARLDGRIHEIVDFDYDAVDGPQPEATAPLSQMAAGLCEILSCLAKGRNLKTSGARVLALLAMLDPIKQSMRNLSEVARLAGCSRAALSKFLVNFRDTYGFGLIAGKLQGSVLLTAKANCVRSETAPIPVSVGKMQKQYNPIKWS